MRAVGDKGFLKLEEFGVRELFITSCQIWVLVDNVFWLFEVENAGLGGVDVVKFCDKTLQRIGSDVIQARQLDGDSAEKHHQGVYWQQQQEN